MTATVGVQFAVNNADLQRAFNDDLRALANFASAANTYNTTAISAVRANIEAQRELGASIGANTASMERLTSISQSFENRVQAAGIAGANAAERMGRGLSMAARSGEFAGRSLNTIISAGADIAFAFGPQGAILAGVAMVAAGIVEHFENADNKIEETVARFNDRMTDLILNDSPIEAARAQAKAYVDELRAQAKAKRDAEAVARFDTAFSNPAAFSNSDLVGRTMGAVGPGWRMLTGQDAAAVGAAQSDGRAAAQTRAFLGAIDAHNKEIDALKGDEHQLRTELATWNERVAALRAEGKSAEAEVAARTRAQLESKVQDLRNQVHTLEQQRIDTARSISQQKGLAPEVQYALNNPTRPRTLTDFSDEDRHAEGADIARRGDAALRAVQSGGRESQLQQQRRERAAELAQELADQEVESTWKRLGMVEQAELAGVDREFRRRAAEIARLKLSKEQETDLLVALERAKAAKLDEIRAQSASRQQSEILSEAERALAAAKVGFDKLLHAEQQAEQRKAQVIQGVVAGSIDGLIKAHESLGVAVLKAAVKPEVTHLEALAAKQFAMAVAAGFANPWEAAKHLAAGAAYTAGAAAVGQIAGIAGGHGGGGSGGGGGAPNTADAQGMARMGGRSGGNDILKIEIVATQKGMDGRELAKTRQKFQRLDDREQPVRVTL